MSDAVKKVPKIQVSQKSEARHSPQVLMHEMLSEVGDKTPGLTVEKESAAMARQQVGSAEEAGQQAVGCQQDDYPRRSEPQQS